MPTQLFTRLLTIGNYSCYHSPCFAFTLFTLSFEASIEGPIPPVPFTLLAPFILLAPFTLNPEASYEGRARPFPPSPSPSLLPLTSARGVYPDPLGVSAFTPSGSGR
jgi:hypothetical protein